MSFGGVASVVTGSAAPGETAIYRSSLMASPSDALWDTLFDGEVTTVRDVVHRVAKEHGDRRALGWRDTLEVINEEREVERVVDGETVKERKTWSYFRCGPYQYITFNELRDRVVAVAKGLVDLGVTKKDIVNIFAASSVNWQVFQHACAQIGTPVATAYATLGEQGLTHSLNEPEVGAIFTNANLLDLFARVLPNTPTVRLVIYDGEASVELLDKIRQMREGLTVVTLDQVRAAGEASTTNLDDLRPAPDDLMCIMYTSGSTGQPKGVMLHHRTIIACAAQGLALVKALKIIDPLHDTQLHFLPLAHILAYVVEMVFLCYGMTCGYGNMKTLSDQAMRDCRGDLAEFGPTHLIGVPLVFEMLRKAIVARVQGSGLVKRALFNAAFLAKHYRIPVASFLADKIVFNAMRARFGGRLKMVLSGGAPLSRETHEFFEATIGSMHNGYGLTETGGALALSGPAFPGARHVGALGPATEMKLVDVPYAGYLTTSSPPQGEVYLRGPCVTPGYFKRPDLNADPTVFVDATDGGPRWFRTGDIGQWNPDGTLSIIDRIKNLVKLSGGEYVALERLEAAFKAVPVVANIAVIANSAYARPIAVILPHEALLRSAIPGAGDAGVAFDELCRRKEAVGYVMGLVQRAAKEEGFTTMEVPAAIVLSADEWTPDNGILTPTQKLQRRKVDEKYKEQIQAAFSKIG